MTPAAVAHHHAPSRNRDLVSGSARSSASLAQYQVLAQRDGLRLFGRVFHGIPARESRVSYGLGSYRIGNDDSLATDVLHLGSYNYAGLNGHPRIIAAAERALRKYGTTTSGVRLLNGTSDLHVELEHRLARFLGMEDCITFSSGYAANLSVLSALCAEGDVVLSDMLNHQSIVDGLRLAGVDVQVYRHNSAASLEHKLRRLPREQRKIIVTDGVFSMDGDVADLPSFVRLAETYNAFLIVDDAHATAAIGPHGRGTAAVFGLERDVDVLTGSLSKGLPGIGGFAAGSARTINALRFGANGYIFSASLPPMIVAGLIEAIGILEEQPEIQERLRFNERYLREGIQAIGLDTMRSASAIIPILMPAAETTQAMTQLLHDEGIYVNPVGYPAVSKTRTRLRLNASADLRRDDMDRCIAALGRFSRQLSIPEQMQARPSAE